jgi:hypothetical protein
MWNLKSMILYSTRYIEYHVIVLFCLGLAYFCLIYNSTMFGSFLMGSFQNWLDFSRQMSDPITDHH